jgi:hypothetical protein
VTLVNLPQEDIDFIRGFHPDRERTASRADLVAVIEHLQEALGPPPPPEDDFARLIAAGWSGCMHDSDDCACSEDRIRRDTLIFLKTPVVRGNHHGPIPEGLRESNPELYRNVQPDSEKCPTPGCDGDGRYASPGRGHRTGCGFPLH